MVLRISLTLVVAVSPDSPSTSFPPFTILRRLVPVPVGPVSETNFPAAGFQTTVPLLVGLPTVRTNPLAWKKSPEKRSVPPFPACQIWAAPSVRSGIISFTPKDCPALEMPPLPTFSTWFPPRFQAPAGVVNRRPLRLRLAVRCGRLAGIPGPKIARSSVRLLAGRTIQLDGSSKSVPLTPVQIRSVACSA